MSYRIKTVSLATGIPSTTLRAWERRYRFITPTRTASGYRVYTNRDIALLARVKGLVDEGFKVSEAIEIARGKDRNLAPLRLSGDEAHRVRESLLEALLRFDRAAAAAAWHRLTAVPAPNQLDQVLLPLMADVGERWQHARCTVGQEHFCSAFVREKLAGMLEVHGTAPRAGAAAASVLCAGAPGELHEFGLMASAVHIASRGRHIVYLGADLPVDEIAAIAERVRPSLVVTSLICTRTRSECVSLAAAFRAAVPEDTTVVLGGRGLAPDLPVNDDRHLYFLRSIAELMELPQLSPTR